jgi:tetratricopeptide (TPR) repeat protein
MAYTSEIDKLQRRYDENPDGRNFAPLADAYRKAGDYEKAIQLCEKGLAKHPTYVSAHIVYGRVHMDLQDFPRSRESFQKVLELDGENVIALKALGEISEKEERFDDAAVWFGKLLNVDPMNSEAAEALGRAKGKLGAAQRAEAVETAKRHDQEREGQRWSGALGAVDSGPKHKAPVAAPPIEMAPPVEARTQEIPSSMLEVEHTSIEPDSLKPSGKPLEGIELAGSVELTPSAQPLEGLESVEFDASGVQPTGPSEFTVEDAAAEFADKVEVMEPDAPTLPTDLPLIMPDEVPSPPRTSKPVPAPVPVASLAPSAPSPPTPEDDGAADATALTGAQEVVTETMAELYLQQGHRDEAVRVYAALVQRNPGDRALKAKYDALTGAGGPAKGGPKVRDFFQGILTRRLTPRGGTPQPAPASEPGAVLDNAFGPDEARGKPTRPADDSISLDSVFGDEKAQGQKPAAAGAGGGGGGGGAAGGGEGGFSFDEFFKPPSSTPSAGQPRASAASDPEDDDQFQAWLKGLKS